METSTCFTVTPLKCTTLGRTREGIGTPWPIWPWSMHMQTQQSRESIQHPYEQNGPRPLRSCWETIQPKGPVVWEVTGMTGEWLVMSSIFEKPEKEWSNRFWWLICGCNRIREILNTRNKRCSSTYIFEVDPVLQNNAKSCFQHSGNFATEVGLGCPWFP